MYNAHTSAHSASCFTFPLLRFSESYNTLCSRITQTYSVHQQFFPVGLCSAVTWSVKWPSLRGVSYADCTVFRTRALVILSLFRCGVRARVRLLIVCSWWHWWAIAARRRLVLGNLQAEYERWARWNRLGAHVIVYRWRNIMACSGNLAHVVYVLCVQGVFTHISMHDLCLTVLVHCLTRWGNS